MYDRKVGSSRSWLSRDSIDYSTHPLCAALLLFPPSRQVTLIREWAQGPNSLLLSFPTGGFDPRKHDSLLACAQMELAEEARLTDGEWVNLMPGEEGSKGLAEGKWITNRFFCFLVRCKLANEQLG